MVYQKFPIQIAIWGYTVYRIPVYHVQTNPSGLKPYSKALEVSEVSAAAEAARMATSSDTQRLLGKGMGQTWRSKRKPVDGCRW